MGRIKRGDERLYYNKEDILNVEVLSARREKDRGIQGVKYRLRIVGNTRTGKTYSDSDPDPDLEIIYWQPNKIEDARLW